MLVIGVIYKIMFKFKYNNIIKIQQIINNNLNKLIFNLDLVLKIIFQMILKINIKISLRPFII